MNAARTDTIYHQSGCMARGVKIADTKKEKRWKSHERLFCQHRNL